MKIKKVETKKDMRVFTHLPQNLFGKDLCYVPPFWKDEKKAYDKRTNPILRNSDFQLFLVVNDEGEVVGRVIAYIDFNHNKYYKGKIGFFGAFECSNDPTAADLLIKSSEGWLKEKGMEEIRGPIHPAARLSENHSHIYKICLLRGVLCVNI